jgi:glyoxylase I family protein
VPELGGVDHVSLTVRDLDRSERFYVGVLGLVRLADFGGVRVLVHRATSLLVALVRHDAARDAPFSELNTGLDHLGFTASGPAELTAWERRFDAYGVTYTPARQMEFGCHLNFRDPDGIALELSTSNEVLAGWLDELREREIPPEEIATRLDAYLTSLSRPSPSGP